MSVELGEVEQVVLSERGWADTAAQGDVYVRSCGDQGEVLRGDVVTGVPEKMYFPYFRLFKNTKIYNVIG